MDRARQLRAEGLDVVSLAGGEPDFDTPSEAVEEAVRALREGFTHYVPSRGIPELRRAIAEKLRRENGLAYDPDSEIVVTVGAKMALLSAILALVEPGEEVVCFGPAWVPYQPMVALAGGRLVAVPLRAEGGRFVFDEQEALGAITARTLPWRGIVEALAARDFDRSMRVVREHYARTAEEMLRREGVIVPLKGANDPRGAVGGVRVGRLTLFRFRGSASAI